MNTKLLAGLSALAALIASTLVACGGGGGYGGGGSMSNPCGAYASCSPSVSISAPAAGATVAGTVTLSASAAAVGTYTVMKVQFRVDGTAVGAAVTTAPYNFAWDSTSVSDGAHLITAVVTDSAGGSATSASVSVNVANNGTFPLTLAPAQLFPVPTSSATGTGTLTFNVSSGAASGSVTLSGITPTAVEVGDAYAGAQSAAVFALTQNATHSNEWDVGASIALTASQVADLKNGKLYVLVRSSAYPNGELRGQVLPANVTVKFATLSGSAEVPAVTSAGSGAGAVTVNTTSMMAAVEVTVAGITATGAELDAGASGAVGTAVASLSVDAQNSNHYLNEAVALVAADLTNYNNGGWYANVFTAAHPTGELRGQFAPPVVAPTLTQLQTQIFTPICSTCHDGTGTVLPGVQNLTAGNTFASIVGVASLEQTSPPLLRIKPGDPDNSYLVQKVEGLAGIMGVRMPKGGTPLTQAQIDSIRAWVSAGAPNN